MSICWSLSETALPASGWLASPLLPPPAPPRGAGVDALLKINFVGPEFSRAAIGKPFSRAEFLDWFRRGLFVFLVLVEFC